MNIEIIEKLSRQEPKSIMERMVKLQEEMGELAQEILINQKVSGSVHKSPGHDGIAGECADVIIVALSIFFKSGHNEDELNQLLEKKCQKWEFLQMNKVGHQ